MARLEAAGRVIAGTARGIRLQGAGPGVRPLGDRLKEALFATLEPELRGAAFLDLFAGTGAGGVEALSRGSATATFVEANARAFATIERNLQAAHVGGPAARLVRADVVAWLRGVPGGPYDVVLVDPPYDQPALLTAALEALAGPGPGPHRGAIVRAGGVVVAKHASKTVVPAEIGLLRSARERRFGDSALTFYRWAQEAG
ncbi:MAG TPA: 16S rRNA (guanine(966)-N(2))-methyltransferase RsmD [Candidatus Limnocylindrales bacterium]|jgi:16S rRNA (guanine966-N2)-methyltransferase